MTSYAGFPGISRVRITATSMEVFFLRAESNQSEAAQGNVVSTTPSEAASQPWNLAPSGTPLEQLQADFPEYDSECLENILLQVNGDIDQARTLLSWPRSVFVLGRWIVRLVQNACRRLIVVAFVRQIPMSADGHIALVTKESLAWTSETLPCHSAEVMQISGTPNHEKNGCRVASRGEFVDASPFTQDFREWALILEACEKDNFWSLYVWDLLFLCTNQGQRWVMLRVDTVIPSIRPGSLCMSVFLTIVPCRQRAWVSFHVRWTWSSKTLFRQLTRLPAGLVTMSVQVGHVVRAEKSEGQVSVWVVVESVRVVGVGWMRMGVVSGVPEIVQVHITKRCGVLLSWPEIVEIWRRTEASDATLLLRQLCCTVENIREIKIRAQKPQTSVLRPAKSNCKFIVNHRWLSLVENRPVSTRVPGARSTRLHDGASVIADHEGERVSVVQTISAALTWSKRVTETSDESLAWIEIMFLYVWCRELFVSRSCIAFHGIRTSGNLQSVHGSEDASGALAFAEPQGGPPSPPPARREPTVQSSSS